MNSESLAKLVKETDDLENDLFGDNYKKQNYNELDSTNPTNGLVGRIRKKVVFRDYNEDDPLADLLSDEEDIETGKQQNVVAPNDKNSLIADLFGLKTSNTTIPTPNIDSKVSNIDTVTKEITGSSKPTEPLPTQSDWLGLTDDPIHLEDSPLPQHTQKAISASKDKNILAIGDNDIKPKVIDEKAKKSSLIEDLFGSRTKSSASIDIDRKSMKLSSDTTTSKSMSDLSKIERSSVPLFGGYAPTVSTSKEPRRGRRISIINDDPLGLLSSTTAELSSVTDTSKKDSTSISKQKKENEETSNKNLLQDLPEWLGGKKSTKNENLEDIQSSPKLNNQINSVNKTEEYVENIQPAKESISNVQSHPDYMSVLMSSELNQQTAIMTMQQQEHELRTATMLSQQNQQLNHLLDQQRLKLNDQEKQFDMLIKKQIERQILLETQMKMQQDRINNYIQTLTAQPSFIPFITIRKDEEHEINNESAGAEQNPENLIKQMKLERSCLEDTLENLKEKHDKEMALLDESYLKQISLLEESMEKIEKRLRLQAEHLETDYETRIEKLKDERVQMENTYKQQIEELKTAHKIHIEEINENHVNHIALILKQHSDVIENISKAKDLENQAVTNITTHKTDLHDLLEMANIIIDGIANIQKKVEQRDINIEDEKQTNLKILEENLQKQRRYIDSQTAVLEKERNEIVTATRSVDSNLARLINEFEENKKQIRETEDRLKRKEEYLTRERELFEERIRWEQEHLQSLKDSWVKDKERQLKEIAKEKDIVVEEKAKIEVFSKVKNNVDDLQKIELEAALKAAQDAISYANEEKRKWLNKLQQLQKQQQSLQEKEEQLMSRAKELQELTQSAVAKRDEGLRALKEAKQIENHYKEKLRQLQTQLEAMAQRENKIATEKLSLARERLALRTAQMDRPEKEVSAHVPHIDNYLPISESKIDSGLLAHFKEVIDPRLLMLKLNLDNELDTSNNYLASMHN